MPIEPKPSSWPDPLVEWAATSTINVDSPTVWFTELAAGMVAAGLPLARFKMMYDMLHPQYAAMSTLWRRGDPQVEVTHPEHAVLESDTYRQSPVYLLDEDLVPEYRRRLEAPDRELEFPILRDLKTDGLTDYFALPLRLANGRTGVAAYATDRAGGFTEGEIERLRQVTRASARGFEIVVRHETSRSLARAYLGSRTGERVLSGAVRRGDGETIDAVVWFSDLRRSTALSVTMPPADFLALLNAYFDCLAGAVQEQGGEVLRFIGDAVLAIFPVDAGEEPACADACRRAVRATRQAAENIATLNVERARIGKHSIGYCIGLHLGPVHYGNIGTAGRVEFTVVGAAANAAAKIANQCKLAGEKVLISEEIVRRLDEPWRDLGEFDLPGVGRKMRLFSLA
ncbi:MAG TPA: adenylate/guanylate cyclase domain-containing protein [Rhodospirillales bacterium]